MRDTSKRAHGSVCFHIHYMPSFPACVGENLQVSFPWRKGVGDEFKTSIGVGGARSDGLPGSDRHGNCSNAKDRSGTLAEKKRIHCAQITSQLLDAGKHS